MNQEIERKFLLAKLPDECSNQIPVRYERYFIYQDDNVELRVQIKDGKYELERKIKSSDLSRETVKIEISQGEFDVLKTFAKKSLMRESYILNESGSFSIKVYLGEYEGLIRLECEFPSEDAAKMFTPPVWAGKEITHTMLGKDSRLSQLDKDQFIKLLAEC